MMIWIAGLVCANWCYSCKSRLDAYLLARAVAREPFEREAADRIKREAAKFQLELEAERRRLAKEREAMENFFEQKLDAAHRETQEEVARRKATEEEAIALGVAAAQRETKGAVANKFSRALAMSNFEKEKAALEEARGAALAEADRERAEQLMNLETEHAAEMEAERAGGFKQLQESSLKLQAAIEQEKKGSVAHKFSTAVSKSKFEMQKAAVEQEREAQLAEADRLRAEQLMKAQEDHTAELEAEREMAMQERQALELLLRKSRQAAKQEEVEHAAKLEAERQRATEERRTTERGFQAQLEAARKTALDEQARRLAAEGSTMRHVLAAEAARLEHEAIERALQAQLEAARQAAEQEEAEHIAIIEAEQRRAKEQREAIERSLKDQLEAARRDVSEAETQWKLAEANMKEALRQAHSQQELAAWVKRQANIKQLIEKRYTNLWTLSWSETQLVGMFSISGEAEEAAIKAQLSDVVSKYFPTIVDIYLRYCSTVETMATKSSDKDVVAKKSSDKDAKKKEDDSKSSGEFVIESEGGFAFGWDVQMPKKAWLQFCQDLGSSALDPKKAAQIFTVVNDLRDKRIELRKLEALHKGIGVTKSDELLFAAQMALDANTFSMSEFLEACVRSATLVTKADPRVMDKCDKAQEAVIAMLDDWLMPFAARYGIRGFREAMGSSPELQLLKLDLGQPFTRLFNAHATAAVSSGSKFVGVSLHRFLEIAEVAKAGLSRARVKTAYVQSLGLDAVSSALLRGAKLLTEDTLWEALLRLALIICEEGATGPHDQRNPFRLAALDEAQLRAVRSELEAMVLYCPASSKEISALSAAKALQGAARGMASRRKGKAPLSKPLSKPKAGTGGFVLA